MKTLLICSALFISLTVGYSQQYVLKWDKQNIQITLPSKSATIAEDTINEIDYFEYVDEPGGYDFAFEMLQKGDPDFEYKKDLYKYALKEIKKEDDEEMNSWRIGKLNGLNSFYAIAEDDDIDSKTGMKYHYVAGEVVFYSKDKKKLFYFDIEYDEVTLDQVEKLVKSIKFYE